ncbi:hypothetical protein T439DRAFT_366513 [Meredithblackwellia eburnea MCA 4105]
MILSDNLVKLTSASSPTITSALVADPTAAPGELAKSLFAVKQRRLSNLLDKLSLKKDKTIEENITENTNEPTLEDLARAAECGRFGETKPSDLFLKIYLESLRTLEGDPLAGVVSPSLTGSTGVMPLTILSVIPDIIGHMADVIVQAKSEIILATNFWEASEQAETITNAFKELSKRAGERGSRVVVKLMYDRGNPKQVVDTHQIVEPEEYTGDRVKLPHPNEIPNLDLEVVNFHVPPVGTFHSKYMIVDRRIVILQSNNIQDRVNVEMMTHLEGPICDSFYDMALLSWSKPFTPPLPLLGKDVARGKYDFGNDHTHIQEKDLEGAKGDNTGAKITATEPKSASSTEFSPHILHSPHEPFPMALVNRRPHGRPGHSDTSVPQDAAFLAAFRYAKKKVFVQTPTFNAPPVVAAALAAVKRGIEVVIISDLGFNDEGELLPFQGGTNEMVASSMYKELETEEQKKLLRMYWYTGKDQKTPLNAKEKSRNCHVKLLIVDDQVGIQGNGNQDVQSWYHSQEINVLIDSPSVCQEWMKAIDSNQNSLLHGELDKDGIWRDEDGKPLPGATGGPKGPFKSLIGVKGAVQRVKGEGGF